MKVVQPGLRVRLRLRRPSNLSRSTWMNGGRPARSKAVNASGSFDRWTVNVSSIAPSVYGVFCD
jgi:hypothetical protein